MVHRPQAVGAAIRGVVQHWGREAGAGLNTYVAHEAGYLPHQSGGLIGNTGARSFTLLNSPCQP